MHVKMNGTRVTIFSGARVNDVLRKYSRAEWTQVRDNRKKVYDRHGHEVGLDGELNGGEELVVRACVRAGQRS